MGWTECCCVEAESLRYISFQVEYSQDQGTRSFSDVWIVNHKLSSRSGFQCPGWAQWWNGLTGSWKTAKAPLALVKTPCNEKAWQKGYISRSCSKKCAGRNCQGFYDSHQKGKPSIMLTATFGNSKGIMRTRVILPTDRIVTIPTVFKIPNVWLA